MRPAWPVLLVAAVLLSGCTSDPAPSPVVPAEGQRWGEVLPPGDPLSAYTWNGTNLIYDELPAPTLTPGTAWTYRQTGASVLASEVTVVVTAAPDGYLFAATEPETLIAAALWGSEHLGRHDEGLNRIGAEPLFAWPLADGKMWESHDQQVTAIAELIETPIGIQPGYRIEASNGSGFVRATFVPAIGYLTSFAIGSGETERLSLELTGVGKAATAHWFEAGQPFHVDSQQQAAAGVGVGMTTADVPTGFDELLFAGKGRGDGKAEARALDPTGPGWGFEGGDDEDWRIGRLAATPGPWMLRATATTDGSAWFQGVPVRWLEIHV